MEKKISTILLYILIALPLMFFSACDKHKDEPDGPRPNNKPVKMTVLLYNISSEYSMAQNYSSDIKEILNAAPYLDLENYNFLIYSVYPDNTEKNPDLRKLTYKNQAANLEEVKVYDRNIYSTDPRRIKDVFNTVLTNYPAERYGLIMAAHGSSWSPKFSDHEVNKYEAQPAKAFGGDDYNHKIDWIDLDELANVIPDNTFEFIWFDACYMSSIEVIYQMRNKCHYFIGYPTEVWIEGMPYDDVLPLLLQDKIDYKGAAEATFYWYNHLDRQVTIGVYDMTKIEELADASAEIFADYDPISEKGLLKYSRYSTGPYYEFKQVAMKTAEKNHPELDLSRFVNALERFTVYAAASSKNFSNQDIPADIYSGLNCHLRLGITSNAESYYEKLDWYKRVYSSK